MITHLPFNLQHFTIEFNRDNFYPETINSKDYTWEYHAQKPIQCTFGSRLEIEITATIKRHDRHKAEGISFELNDLPRTAEELHKIKRNISGEFIMVFDEDPLKKLGI